MITSAPSQGAAQAPSVWSHHWPTTKGRSALRFRFAAAAWAWAWFHTIARRSGDPNRGAAQKRRSSIRSRPAPACAAAYSGSLRQWEPPAMGTLTPSARSASASAFHWADSAASQNLRPEPCALFCASARSASACESGRAAGLSIRSNSDNSPASVTHARTGSSFSARPVSGLTCPRRSPAVSTARARISGSNAAAGPPPGGSPLGSRIPSPERNRRWPWSSIAM
jgi:hypothetical protein